MEDAKTIVDILRRDPEADVSNIVTKYQLRATLLDSVIPSCLQLLSTCHIERQSFAVLRTIYVFCRVRGYKIILQNLPTDARLLGLLRDSLNNAGDDDWECHYSLLLWLATVVITPFDLDALEAGLFENLYGTAEYYLQKSGIQRDAAALLMARLLTRVESQQGPLTDRFLASYNNCNKQSFASLGKLQVIADVMDRVTSIPPSIRMLVVEAEQQAYSEEDEALKLWSHGSTLTLRLWVKILGRAALRDLGSFAEFAVSEFIQLFDDKSSQVRMAAAKYVARIARKLDSEASSDIIESIVESLAVEDARYASPDYWNGALIALAEMIRRSTPFDEALLNRLVYEALEIKGLHFIQPRLRTNIGGNVRDAACYACWSLFRARGINLSRELRDTLYSSLIALACLDSEVNVRRAAAAALQEGLGRFGASAGDMSALKMFDIIEKININTVSLTKTCYEDIAPLFCNLRHFVSHYIRHGINNANPDVRRLAAHAASSFKGCAKEIVDALIEHRFVADDSISLHGKLLALGELSGHSSELSADYRVGELKAMINPELAASSDLVAEGMLTLVAIQPELATSVMERVLSDEEHVVRAASRLMLQLPEDLLVKDLLPLCSIKVGDSRLFVACVVQIYQRLQRKDTELRRLVLRCMRLPDPNSRALALQCIDDTSLDYMEMLLVSLRDYSVDARGDVGAWVREAAITQILVLFSATQSKEWVTLDMQSQLWKMASESRQKIRIISASALLGLGFISRELNTSDTGQFFLSLLEQCPPDMRSVLATGLSASVGAARASLATIEGSLNGLLAFLHAHEDWILTEIMQLERSSPARTFEVIRTLKRIILTGIEMSNHHTNRCLAIAFNTTLNVRLSEQTLADAIDILETYAMRDYAKARERLIGILNRHPNGLVRQRSADALFELGIENEILETVDWTRRDYAQHSSKLSM